MTAAALALASSCGDAAVDGRYEGEPRFIVEVSLNAVTPSADTRFALRWDGGAEVTLASSARGPGRFALAILDEPAGSDTRAALGQLLAYEAEGAPVAASHLLVADVPGAGFMVVAPVRQCASAAAEGVRDGFAPLPGRSEVTLFARRFVPLYSAADCAADALGYHGECAPLPVVRWVCRHVDASAALCGWCEWLAFSEGASPAACDAWRADCDARPDAATLDCAAEHALCLLGEDARATPCDRACTCDKLEAACLAETGSADICAAKAEGCHAMP